MLHSHKMVQEGTLRSGPPDLCVLPKNEALMMKLGYTIIYVPDVSASLKFYSDAFGLGERFLHESGDYGELNTGDTTLAFASHKLGSLNFPAGYVRGSESESPLGFEIALVTDDVATAHAKAMKAGAIEIWPIEEKPWGQTITYLR